MQLVTGYKGTVDEIPVGYVALDVQKVQYQDICNNKTWTNLQVLMLAGGEHSCVYNGNAYYSAQLGTTGGTVQAGAQLLPIQQAQYLTGRLLGHLLVQ